MAKGFEGVRFSTDCEGFEEASGDAVPVKKENSRRPVTRQTVNTAAAKHLDADLAAKMKKMREREQLLGVRHGEFTQADADGASADVGSGEVVHENSVAIAQQQIFLGLMTVNTAATKQLDADLAAKMQTMRAGESILGASCGEVPQSDARYGSDTRPNAPLKSLDSEFTESKTVVASAVATSKVHAPWDDHRAAGPSKALSSDLASGSEKYDPQKTLVNQCLPPVFACPANIADARLSAPVESQEDRGLRIHSPDLQALNFADSASVPVGQQDLRATRIASSRGGRNHRRKALRHSDGREYFDDGACKPYGKLASDGNTYERGGVSFWE